MADHRATVLLFGASIFGMSFVQQQFFPPSDRPELIVDWNLPQNASIAETAPRWRASRRTAGGQSRHRSLVDLCRPGRGALRAVLRRAAGQPVFRADRHRHQGHRGARPAPRAAAEDYLTRRFRRHRRLREAARHRAAGRPARAVPRQRTRHPDRCASWRRSSPASSRHNPNLADTDYDWNEPARVVKVDVLQDKARQLGVTSQDIATALNGIVGGVDRHAGARRHLSDQRHRAARATPSAARSRRCRTCSCRPAAASRCRSRRSPTSATTSSSRRSGGATACRPSPCRPACVGAVQPATVVNELKPKIDAFIAKLPVGYEVATGGSVEESAKARGRSPPSRR